MRHRTSIFLAPLFTCLLPSSPLGCGRVREEPPRVPVSTNAPQAPRSESTVVPSGVAELAGEFLFPETPTRAVPLVIIVHGSGRLDRNGIGPDGCCNTYGLLAAGLAKRGIASFRYDKRGWGRSSPDLVPEERTVQKFVDDVVAVFERVRRDPRVGKITLLGHSEGSDVALEAALRVKPEAIISLGGSGRPLLAVLRTQLAAQVDQATLAAFERLVVDVQAGRPLDAVPEALKALFVPRAVPWLRSSLNLDPTVSAARTAVPTCVARGEYDVQVTAEDTDLLLRAMPRARKIVLARTSHLMKSEERAALPQASYSERDRPLAEGLVETLLPCVAR